jgi:plastocyanin domain-containing protein
MKNLAILAFALALSPATALADAKQPRRIELAITEKGFEPDKVTVKKGEPVILAFTRKTDKTCTKEVVVHDDKQKVEKKLPLNTRVEIAVTFSVAGELGFACAMNMDKGVIRVQ